MEVKVTLISQTPVGFISPYKHRGLPGVNNEGDPLAAVATPPLMAKLMDLGKGGKIPLLRY